MKKRQSQCSGYLGCTADHPRTQGLRNSVCYNVSQLLGCWLSWAVVRCVSDGVGPDGGWSWSHWKARLGQASKWLLYTRLPSPRFPLRCVSLSPAEEPGPPPWCSGFLEAGCGTAWHLSHSVQSEGLQSWRARGATGEYVGWAMLPPPSLERKPSSPRKSGPEPVC